MKAKYNRLFLPLSILLFLTIQSPAQQKETFKKFAGTYITGHDFGGGSIKLETDGTFSHRDFSDDGAETSTSGSYVFYDGVLHFKIAKQIGKRAFDKKEFNLLELNERKEMFHGDDNGKIESEFEYLPIEWIDRIYLISEGELKNFANAINLGIEPRASLISDSVFSPWYGSFYLRSGDEQKKVVGKPNLPEKWLSFLLNKPLTATVISIQNVEKREFITISTATINKGSKDGLKVGMRFVTRNEVPTQWDATEVISVEKNKAKIQARTKLKLGDKLNTKYKPKIFYR